MSATDIGWGSDGAAGPTLTPAAAGAVAGSILAAAPATGCTTWGWPCGSSASGNFDDAVDEAVNAGGAGLRNPQCRDAYERVSAVSATTEILRRRTRSSMPDDPGQAQRYPVVVEVSPA